MSWSINRLTAAIVVATLTTAAAGCAGEEAMVAPGGTGSTNVSQGGAQDFALFRSIVNAGEVPSPDTLDAIGFFAEHAVDLPPADCGNDICLHPMLAVAPRFDGSNWTMGFVAMNTPLDPATLPRPPLHVVVAVESSNSSAPLDVALRDGLGELASVLRAEDRLSVLTYNNHTEVLLQASDPAQFSLSSLDLYPSISPDGSADEVDMYSGLARAHGVLAEVPGFDAKRIILVTSGKANAGIDSAEHIVALGEGIAKEGVALGIVGVGKDYDASIPTQLGSLGAGAYSYAPTFKEIPEVMRLEGETTLFPLATDFRMSIKAAEGYRIGRIYGAKRAFVAGPYARLELPALFIGQRAGAKDVGGGRRGGGGGLFIELLVDEASAGQVDAGKPAMTLKADWNETSGAVSITTDVINQLPPGVNPAGMWPLFSQPDYGKPFMMLNMYLAFNASVGLYQDGDCARAKGVVDMMAPSIEGWQAAFADPDIGEDYQLMLKLRNNLDNRCQAQAPIRPITFHGGCMAL